MGIDGAIGVLSVSNPRIVLVPGMSLSRRRDAMLRGLSASYAGMCAPPTIMWWEAGEPVSGDVGGNVRGAGGRVRSIMAIG